MGAAGLPCLNLGNKENGMFQGGRSWPPFGEGKNGHKSFRQARICYFRDKCVVFARNCKFASWIHYDMQYIPYLIVHFLPKKHCFWPQKPFSWPKSSKKCVNHDDNFDKKAYMLGLKMFVQIQTFRWWPFVPSHNFCHPASMYFNQCHSFFRTPDKVWWASSCLGW